MKNAAIEPLQSAIKTHNAALTEIAVLEKLTVDTAARRNSLECSCDLADEKALNEITRLQVVEALLPRRIVNREEAFTNAQAALLKASHEFIYKQHGPRIRGLVNRAKDKTRDALRQHFSDPNELEKAVAKSSLVVELENLSFYATVRQPEAGQLVAYAETLLRAWADCDHHEAKLAA